MSARVRILLMASLAAAHAAPVPAQEAAVLWPTALFGGARTVGLGGSYVGLSDDINATASNPAGLVTLPRSFEVDAALGQLRPGLRPSFFGLGFHPNRWAAVGVSLGRVEPHRVGAAIGEVVGSGGPAMPFVSASAPGLSLALRLAPGVAAGVTVRKWRLSGYPDEPRAGAPSIGRDWATGWTAGVLMFPGGPEAAHLGLTFQREIGWTIDASRDARRLVRAPSVLTAGVSWHYDVFRSTRVLFTTAADLVRYSHVAALPSSVLPHDDVNVGLGLEISHPLGRCFSGCGGMVQLRAGLANRGRQPGGALLEGRRMVWTTGGALALQQVMTGKLRLEMAWREETRAFMAGLGLRFPSSYRGDLENHARRR